MAVARRGQWNACRNFAACPERHRKAERLASQHIRRPKGLKALGINKFSSWFSARTLSSDGLQRFA